MNWKIPFFKKNEICFEDAVERIVFVSAEERLKVQEKQYCELVKEASHSVNPQGLLRLRLFALNFPICAMTQALGSERGARAEAVYLELLKLAFDGIRLSRLEKETVSKELLRDQSKALLSEERSVGAGQYALAAIYEKSLKLSLGKAIFGMEDFSSILGRVVGENLAVWSEIYQKITGNPMQRYQEGFSPTDKDARPLGDA